MTSLNPVLTIEEQIAEGLLIHESCTPAERHEKVLAIMHEVELPDPVSYTHLINLETNASFSSLVPA